MNFGRRSPAPIAIAFALFATPAGAQEVQRGTKLICDTVEQIDQFVNAKEAGKDPMQVVNAEGPVCGFGQIAYVKGQKIKDLATKDGTVEVVAILWVGTGFNGRFHAVKPEKQFTVFLAKGNDI